MKPGNFPARKLARQIGAKNGIWSDLVLKSSFGEIKNAIDTARNVRTKKRR
jgi:hypothetical protein